MRWERSADADVRFQKQDWDCGIRSLWLWPWLWLWRFKLKFKAGLRYMDLEAWSSGWSKLHQHHESSRSTGRRTNFLHEAVCRAPSPALILPFSCLRFPTPSTLESVAYDIQVQKPYTASVYTSNSRCIFQITTAYSGLNVLFYRSSQFQQIHLQAFVASMATQRARRGE